MKIEGQHTFDVPQESLWEALLDPEILSKTLPGCEKLTEVGDNDYKGTMHIGIGPVQGRFEGQFSILDMDPPENYQLKLEGKGPTGFLQGKGEIRLEIDGQSTILHYEIDVQVGGPVAGVGQRLLESSARAITRQALERLHKLVKARHETETGGAPAQEVDSPSESQLAAGITQDFLSSMPPRERRIMVVSASAAIVFILLMVYFRACGA